jgi:hypothetical protein
MYLLDLILHMLKDRLHMQTVLSRACHRIGIFVVDALPISAKVSILAFDIYR